MQSQTVDLILLSILPIICMFGMERWTLSFMRKTEARKQFVINCWWLHPNTISRARYFAGILSVLIYLYISEEFAILFFSFWMISDVTDGSIAKHFGLETEEGKVIDPLSDKLLYFPPLFFAAYLDLLSWPLVITFFVIDASGQLSRHFIKEKAANLFGKTKTFVAVTSVSLPFLQQVHFAYQVFDIGDVLLSGTIFLAFLSFFSKVVPSFWYANILSLLNLVCGIAGMLVILLGYPPINALILIFIGQFLDLFDGRAAERWGSTPKGEIFDDLADGTNFGGTVAIMIFSLVENFYLSVILAGVYFFCAVYRLIRFLSDKKEAGVGTGVSIFKGMPTPGAALLTGGGILVIDYFRTELLFLSVDMQLALISLISSLIMISHIPYIHFGRVVLVKIPRMIKVILGGFFVALIGYTVKRPDDIYLAAFVFACALTYLFLGISLGKPLKKQAIK